MACATLAQNEEYRVYTPHPRLFLPSRHLRLLKRERERQSMRWLQFEKLMKGPAPMREPGFAQALYSITAGDADAAQNAIKWALGNTSDLRQLAIVYDWCNDALSPAQAEQLRGKIAHELARPPAGSLAAERDRILATIAIADDSAHGEEPVLRDAVEHWFRKQFAPQIESGKSALFPSDAYAVLEILHAIHDNLNIDLREAAPEYFRNLPLLLVVSNYPAGLRAADDEYRIPVYSGSGQPSLTAAALSRAAGLSMVALDSNSTESQFLQGWLIQDRYILRESFGAPYEFLWANPYQPGLSYFHLPLEFYDARSGTLFLRSSWEDDATWFGVFAGEEQLFSDGKVTVLNRKAGLQSAPFELGDAFVVPARLPIDFTAETKSVFVVGLVPRREYLIEVEGSEARQEQADPAGTLAIQIPPDRKLRIRIKEVPNGQKRT